MTRAAAEKQLFGAIIIDVNDGTGRKRMSRRKVIALVERHIDRREVRNVDAIQRNVVVDASVVQAATDHHEHNQQHKHYQPAEKPLDDFHLFELPISRNAY